MQYQIITNHHRRILMPKFRVIVNETNTVVYEIEANDEDHASDLIHKTL